MEFSLTLVVDELAEVINWIKLCYGGFENGKESACYG
jgi:hypothetical protein